LSEPGPRAGSAIGPVYFLSDYGRADEFVGVVHAVLARRAPGIVVIDLTHDVAPFDVAGGARTLERAVRHLGPGVVLAVVDPGVGGRRRALVATATGPGPGYFVGPDNGLLPPALDALGGPSATFALAKTEDGPATFDGRDVFAPAVAALCSGARPEALGGAVDPTSLVRLPAPRLERTDLGEGHGRLRVEVTWIDRFGNVQLAARDDGPGLGRSASVGVPRARGSVTAPHRLRVVRTFSDLHQGELGMLLDANDRLALVVGEGSAADRLGVGVGDLVELVW
jgi:S-adenosyl-L-methionine hydrolase (adenosine-forming)